MEPTRDNVMVVPVKAARCFWTRNWRSAETGEAVALTGRKAQRPLGKAIDMIIDVEFICAPPLSRLRRWRGRISLKIRTLYRMNGREPQYRALVRCCTIYLPVGLTFICLHGLATAANVYRAFSTDAMVKIT